MYSWRGYEVQQDEDSQRPGELTLQVCRDDQVIATLTICHDSESGLPADTLYRDELDRYRERGARLCEFTRLAVDPAHGSKEVLGTLFSHAVEVAMGGGATEVFIEVNPRHVGFYKRVLSFRRKGEEKVCDRVKAPAILLHQALEDIRRQFAESAERHRRDAACPQPHAALAGARRRVRDPQPVYAS
jgi:hypothetical protein